ncbi:MAG: ABC transporter ATP-binding protein [Oscillospiraceae bacterium]|nr:ABC transporter ATP-binding protein [Oscillospiraceae bacterium]
MQQKSKKIYKLSLRKACELNIRSLKLWWKNYPSLFRAALINDLFSILPPYAGIYLSAKIITELAGGRDPQDLARLVVITLIVTTSLELVGWGISRWRDWEFSGNYDKALNFFTKKLLHMDYQSLDSAMTHDLLSRVENNPTWVGGGIGESIYQWETLLFAIMQIIGAVSLSVSLFTLRVPQSAGILTILNNPIFLFLIIAVMFTVTVFAPACSTKASSYHSKLADEMQTSSRTDWFYSSMANDRTRAEDIRIYRQDEFCREILMKARITNLSARLSQYMRGPIGGYHALGAAVSNVFTGIAYAFVCVKAWAGAFGIGAVTQYIGAITALSGSVSSLLGTLGKMRSNAEFLSDTFQFLDIPNDLHKEGMAVKPDADSHYEIEFHNVSFRYPGSEIYALQNASFKLKVGDRLAVVGQNGSGKTTFIKLLCRLYDPTEGSITLNGTDIREFCYEEYLKLFSVVFQDFRLPAFKLGQDVAAAEEYNSDCALSCLEKAGFRTRLNTLQRGLETPLYRDFDKSGVEISGGEAQKIALARALYKDAPFIVLDEPTAALDPIAEYEIYSKFNEIVGDKTAIYISHRLSSCRFCDDIAVFHEGKLIQRGSHDELVAYEDGKYYELWHAQAQYYAEEVKCK